MEAVAVGGADTRFRAQGVDEVASLLAFGAAWRCRFVILQKRNEGLTIIRQFETDHDFDRFDT